MYHVLKKNIKAFLPESFLISNEEYFRSAFGVFYLGNNCKCNICDKSLRQFISLKNGDLLCPFCGSLSRNRRLWNVLIKDHSIRGNVLHFSPSRSLYRLFKKNLEINYYSSDFENEFLADYQFNITQINQEDDKFDCIICYHILEHIEDDISAMKELYRVLKSSGTLYIQTPFKEGDIYEDEAITSNKERLLHFGQEDHVRVYSINGLKERLEKVGFKLVVNTFQKREKDNFIGLLSPETIILASK